MIATQVYEYNIEQEIYNYIKNQREGILYFIPYSNVAFVGRSHKIDKTLASENDIRVLELQNEGGIIIQKPFSLAIGHFSKKLDNTFNKDFAKHIIDFLKVKGITAKIESNDILVEDIYKVGSFSSRRYGNIIFSAFQLPYEVDLDLIKQLCDKPMSKIPKGLKELGVSDYEILSEFNIFIKSL